MAIQERLALVLSGGAVALLLQQLWIYTQRSRLPCPPPRRKAEDEEEEDVQKKKPPQGVPRRSSPQPPPETGFADQFIQGIVNALSMTFHGISSNPFMVRPLFMLVDVRE